MAEGQRLRKHQAKRAVAALKEEIGATDRGRLDELLQEIDGDGRIRLSAALDRLFPDFSVEDALTRFRQLRARLRQAAEVAGVDLELAVDTDKRSAPEGRWCWFEGESRAVAEAERYSREEARGAQPEETIPQTAVVPLEHRDGKPVLRYFVSYAHKDRRLMEDLMGKVEPCFKNAKDFVIEGWDDRDILVGERWKSQIERAIDRCHFGLLLVSHNFLASDFITREELPRFIPSEGEGPVAWRRGIPVALKGVSFDENFDFQGLKDHQLFRLDDRSYYERQGPKRDEFAEELVRQILAVAHKHVERTGQGSTVVGDGAQWRRPLESVRPDGDGKLSHSLLVARHQRRFLEEGEESLDQAVPTEGVPTRLSKEVEEGVGGERVDALGYLVDWLRRPGAPAFCALLGDYGMGKTTTCKALTQRLLDEREEDPSLPLPIYLDLRHLGEAAKSDPSLTEILDTVIRRSWQGGREVSELEAGEIVRLVQEEGALVLFDGLDEVLVHLSPVAGQRFTRELWRILPPAVFRRGDDAGAKAGRLLISCRTHYFRSLREQATHLTGEDREGISASDYQALLLLPFTDEQVREYLRRNLPDQDVDRLLDLIRSVHNLPELAERPYTLSLIAGQIGQLERWKMEGRTVNGVTLYRSMVRSWLERDTGKHQLTPDHKQRLMEHLAAELWRSGQRTWNVADLEQWLIDFLEDHPRFAAHYRTKDPELLKEDLRTATFLVRQGEDEFRFAHTSLQEFFLAAALHRALVEERLEEWAMEVPSRETLDFLGQLLEEEGTEAGLASLRVLRDEYRPLASELAFAYGLHAARRGLPAPSLAGVQLPGADLREWRLEGPEEGPPLNLRQADLSDARLDRASFRRVSLDGARLRGASLVQAEVLDGSARRADFGDAALAGCCFRNANLEQACFQDAAFHRTRFLGCRLAGAMDLPREMPQVMLAGCEPAGEYPSARPRRGAKPAAMGSTGPAGMVWSCGFSADGGRVVSSGDDGTVRVWDSASGDPLLKLEGHWGGVLSCGFSADGGRVVSSGEDGTVRVWEAASGDPLLKLEGHAGWVFSCGFSADGGRVVSSGFDGTVRVWDSASGDPLLKLEGHVGGVLSCGFSADGGRVVSSGDDGTVRVWDSASGDPLLKVEGHGGGVRSCGFSADGGRVVSSGDDGTVRVWDSASGDPLLKLEGHGGGVLSCGLSADGGRVVSSGSDGTVRVWDSASGDPLLKLQGHGGWVLSCGFSADGGRVVSSGEDGTVRVWDSASGDPLLKLQGHSGRVLSCGFSADGGRVVSSGDDGTVRVWDSASGDPLLKLEGHEGWVSSCGFSADGGRVVSSGFDGTVRVWDSASGEPLLKLEGHEGVVWSCGFSAHGDRLVSSGEDGTVRVWDSASGEPLLKLEGHEGVAFSCGFSTDGSRLVSSGEDGAVRVWDSASGEPLLKLEGHVGWVWSCGFSADGGRVVSSGSDGTVRVWDSASGKPLLKQEGHVGGVPSCGFSADGGRVVSSGSDGTVRVWNSSSGEPVGFRLWSFPGGEAAVLSPGADDIRWATPGAWRWLVWAALDPATGAMTTYPAEIFGPLPPPPVSTRS